MLGERVLQVSNTKKFGRHLSLADKGITSIAKAYTITKV